MFDDLPVKHRDLSSSQTICHQRASPVGQNRAAVELGGATKEKTVRVTELTFLDEDQRQIHADTMTLGFDNPKLPNDGVDVSYFHEIECDSPTH